MSAAENGKRCVDIFLAVLGGLLIAIAITSPVYSGVEGLVAVDEETAFQRLYAVYCQCVSSNAFLTGVLALLFAAALYATRGFRRPARSLLIVLCAAFGIVEVLSLHLDVHDGWTFAFGNLWYSIFSLVNMAGCALLMYLLGGMLHRLYDSGTLCTGRTETASGLKQFWQTRTLLCAFLAILACWLPWLIWYYPGSVPYDAAAQIRQFIGYDVFTADHPVLSTWLVGGFFSVGRALGSDNLGIFLYCLTQSCFCAAVYAGVIAFIKRCGAPSVLQLIILAYYALSPMFWGFAMCSYKDTLFTGLFALLMLMSAQAIRFPEQYQEKPSRLLSYGLVTLLVCLVRNNGAFAAIPVALAVSLVAFRGRLRIRSLGVCALCAVLLIGFHSFTKIVLDIPEGSVSEAMSIPFQQTARYVRDYGDEVTEQEREAIDRVLDYDSLAASYRSGISDPVKRSYKHPDKAALSEYLRVWLQMSLKHPACYAQATMANSYGYYAFTRAVDVKPRIEAGMENELLEEAGLDIHYVFSDAVWPRMRYVDLFLSRIPVLGLFSVSAVHTWFMLMSAAWLIRSRKGKTLIAVLPLLILLLSCIVMPVNDYLRYYMPVMASMPLLTWLTASAKNNR